MTDDLDHDLVEGITTNYVDPWDTSTGKLRTLSEEIVAGMELPKREVWLALAAAGNDLEAAEEAQRLASKDVHQSANDAAEATNNLIKARPVISQQAAHLAAITAHRTGKGASAAISKEVVAAEAAVVAADVKLGLAHKAVHRSKDAVEKARAAFFSELVRWNELQKPLTQAQLIQQVSATQPARDAVAAKHAAAVPPSKLDALMKNTRGRRGREIQFPGKAPIYKAPAQR